MKKKWVAFILSFGIWSCAKTGDNKVANSLSNQQADSIAYDTINPDSLFKLGSYLETRNIDTAKFKTIDFDCAVLIYPTDEQIAKMKQDYGEDDFHTVADDANWYQGEAVVLLDSMKIQSIAADRPYIKFIGTQGEWTLNLRKKGLPEWNLILFNRKKKPEVIPAIDLTAENIKQYFYY